MNTVLLFPLIGIWQMVSAVSNCVESFAIAIISSVAIKFLATINHSEPQLWDDDVLDAYAPE
ncbi:MAG: hypothetical protein M0R33_17285 [Methylomonas sp.]|uniref:hypothetical protein n=1 Tax=Methylomonas sp. TaxID=418 RepID=UPI0025E7122B|nr:hypothetical protein [Methylomonas sp.]MCK9608201.1 hypothetical protein [Methylomonas sp.]